MILRIYFLREFCISEICPQNLSFTSYFDFSETYCLVFIDAEFSFIHFFHSFESYIIGRFYRITQILQLSTDHITTRIESCDTLSSTAWLIWRDFLVVTCVDATEFLCIRHGTVPSIAENLCRSDPEDLREDIAKESSICRVCDRRYAHESDDHSCDDSGNEGFLHKKEIHDKILLSEIICNSLEISSTFSQYGWSHLLSFLGWCDFLVQIFLFQSHIFSSIERRVYSRSFIHTTSSHRKISRSSRSMKAP